MPVHRLDEPGLLGNRQKVARGQQAAGLGVNAGHDLNRDNLDAFLREVPGVSEVSIGHALIADALELGYAETIRGYLKAIHQAVHPLK